MKTSNLYNVAIQVITCQYVDGWQMPRLILGQINMILERRSRSQKLFSGLWNLIIIPATQLIAFQYVTSTWKLWKGLSGYDIHITLESRSRSQVIYCSNSFHITLVWSQYLIIATPPPSPTPKGRSGTTVFASDTCLFVRVFICSFAWHTLVSGLSFLNQTTQDDIAFWQNDRSNQDLVGLGHDLLSISHIGLQTFIREWNRLVEIGSGQITIIGEGDIVSGNYLFYFYTNTTIHSLPYK